MSRLISIKDEDFSSDIVAVSKDGEVSYWKSHTLAEPGTEVMCDVICLLITASFRKLPRTLHQGGTIASYDRFWIRGT
jgi:hypothetical protein